MFAIMAAESNYVPKSKVFIASAPMGAVAADTSRIEATAMSAQVMFFFMAASLHACLDGSDKFGKFRRSFFIGVKGVLQLAIERTRIVRVGV